MNTTKSIAEQLAAPYAADEIRWKPQSVSGNRALAVCYVDARAVMDRLDAVLGGDGWQDRSELLPGGSVVCKLRCRIGEQWVVKSDVGSPPEQPQAGAKQEGGFRAGA